MKNRLKIDFTFLNKAVKTSGIKKQEIATKIGVGREAFHRWTTGKVAYLEEHKIEKLARILECDPTLIAPEV